MKRLFFLGVLVLFFFSGVLCLMAEPTARYIVTFKSSDEIARPEMSRADFIRSLQFNLDKNLTEVKSPSLFHEVDKLWAANAIVISATDQEAKEISGLSNVERVTKSLYKKWINDPVPDKNNLVLRDGGNEPVWNIAKVNAPKVWSDLKIDGSGIVVGVIDSGIDANHPYLAGKCVAFKDFTKAAKKEPYDDLGHGTHVSGTIAGGNGVGMAPGSKLIVAKVFDANGGGEDEVMLKAMQWIMDPDGNPATNDSPKFVNNSWGSNANDKNCWEITKNWVAAGILPIFSAGNQGPAGIVGSPGDYPHVFAVGASTKDDWGFYFSSIGPSVWDGVTYIKPDIAAPGSSIVSCKVGGGTVSMNGTSMAAPHVAGLVALMMQANPRLSSPQICSLIASTAIDLGAPGKDIKFGYGRIDAFACVSQALAQTNLQTPFAAFKDILETEEALVGIQPLSALAAPFAHSLAVRASQMDKVEFQSLLNQFSNDPLLSSILKEASKIRSFNSLQK
ncbi:MAG: S8 family serine peptidase [Candidatus Riflebacteria bacterium]|nr:S8 family serine peptidase [Candidatus Riflebacteria bacterium]